MCTASCVCVHYYSIEHVFLCQSCNSYFSLYFINCSVFNQGRNRILSGWLFSSRETSDSSDRQLGTDGIFLCTFLRKFQFLFIVFLACPHIFSACQIRCHDNFKINTIFNLTSDLIIIIHIT